MLAIWFERDARTVKDKRSVEEVWETSCFHDPLDCGGQEFVGVLVRIIFLD